MKMVNKAWVDSITILINGTMLVDFPKFRMT